MLVSVTDLRRFLGGATVPEGMQGEMENVLSRAQAVVETYLNRPVEKVQVREVARADSKGFVYLSCSPVWKVISVGGSPVTPDAPITTPTYTVVPDESLGDDPRIIDKVPNSMVTNGYRIESWPGRLWVGYNFYQQNYLVEYIAGLDPAQIDDIKRVILQMAAREWAAHNIDAVGLDGGNPSTGSIQDTRGLSMADDEQNAIARYRRRIFM